MAKKLYLMSGHTSTGRLKGLDGRALSDADNGNVLVVNLSWPDPAKTQDKKRFFDTYFQEVGADNVAFIEEQTPDEQVREEFERAGLVYLPGGDTKTLIQNLRGKGLVTHLQSFGGVISGNIAGAYAMCQDYLRIGRGTPEIIHSLGLVSFCTKAHYEPRFDYDLTQLSKGRVIYGLEDESAIVSCRELSFTGNIWRFTKGRKEKVN